MGIHNSEMAVLQTNVTLWATTEDNETYSKHINIKYLPNFFVLPEVELAENSNAGQMFVIGLPEVLQQIQVNFNKTGAYSNVNCVKYF